MPSPVILLAYADDPNDPLRHIKNEVIQIRDYFLEARQDIEVVLVEDADAEKIADKIRLLRDRLIIFHYAGHANSRQLQLDKGTLANAAGIAGLLGQVPNLKLAFLNGCSTKGQVGLLLDARVKAVLATAVPVNDFSASQFAMRFYEALARYFTLTDAFGFAKAFVLTVASNKDYFSDKDSRQLGSPPGDKQDSIAWGLYFNDNEGSSNDMNELGEWTLPDNTQFADADANYEPNRKLIRTISSHATEMAATVLAPYMDPAKPDDAPKQTGNYEVDMELLELHTLKKLEKIYRENDEGFQELSFSVMNVLPHPVGIHIQKMLAVDKLGYDREEKYLQLLTHQVELFNTLVKFCGFVMLSCLWDVIEKRRPVGQPRLDVTQGQWAYLDKFFSIRGDEQSDLDFIYFIRTVGEILAKNETKPFIEEYLLLKESFSNKDEFYNSNLSIQGLRSRLKNKKILPAHMPDLCRQTEDQLCLVFDRIFFIMNYKLVVIKDIQILKPRYSEGLCYQHRRIILNKAGYPTLTDREFNYTDCTDSYSVILVKGLLSFNSYLSLSPFVIDENALLGMENSRLLFLKNIVNGDPTFQALDDSRKQLKVMETTYGKDQGIKQKDLAKVNSRFAIIKEQYNVFRDRVQLAERPILLSRILVGNGTHMYVIMKKALAKTLGYEKNINIPIKNAKDIVEAKDKFCGMIRDKNVRTVIIGNKTINDDKMRLLRDPQIQEALTLPKGEDVFDNIGHNQEYLDHLQRIKDSIVSGAIDVLIVIAFAPVNHIIYRNLIDSDPGDLELCYINFNLSKMVEEKASYGLYVRPDAIENLQKLEKLRDFLNAVREFAESAPKDDLIADISNQLADLYYNDEPLKGDLTDKNIDNISKVERMIYDLGEIEYSNRSLPLINLMVDMLQESAG